LLKLDPRTVEKGTLFCDAVQFNVDKEAMMKEILKRFRAELKLKDMKV